MVKKILLALAIVASGSFAASFNDNIESMIKKETQTDVKVVEKIELKGSKDLVFIIIEVADNSERVPLFATKNGNTIMGLSNIFFTNSKADKDVINKAIEDTLAYNQNSKKLAAEKLLEALKPEQYIALKSSAKNPKTYFIVSDPNCGYCREELKDIDNKLKTHDVNIVVVGILGEDSQKKSAYLMNRINNKMSQKDKLNEIREVFSSNFKAPKTIDIGEIRDTTDFLFKTGVITGVPYIHETIQ